MGIPGQPPEQPARPSRMRNGHYPFGFYPFVLATVREAQAFRSHDGAEAFYAIPYARYLELYQSVRSAQRRLRRVTSLGTDGRLHATYRATGWYRLEYTDPNALATALRALSPTQSVWITAYGTLLVGYPLEDQDSNSGKGWRTLGKILFADAMRTPDEMEKRLSIDESDIFDEMERWTLRWK